MTDDDIVDPNDPINTSDELKRSENSSLDAIRNQENVAAKEQILSPKQTLYNQAQPS